MKGKGLPLLVFLCCLLALLISLRLFWNGAVFADEFNTSPTAMCGGSLWLAADWLRMGLLALATVVSGVKLAQK